MWSTCSVWTVTELWWSWLYFFNIVVIALSKAVEKDVKCLIHLINNWPCLRFCSLLITAYSILYLKGENESSNYDIMKQLVKEVQEVEQIKNDSLCTEKNFRLPYLLVYESTYFSRNNEKFDFWPWKWGVDLYTRSSYTQVNTVVAILC